jgi:hypothetical protein
MPPAVLDSEPPPVLVVDDHAANLLAIQGILST